MGGAGEGEGQCASAFQLIFNNTSHVCMHGYTAVVATATTQYMYLAPGHHFGVDTPGPKHTCPKPAKSSRALKSVPPIDAQQLMLEVTTGGFC